MGILDIFKRYRNYKQTIIGRYYIETAYFCKHEMAVINIDFNFPTRKDMTFSIGASLFTCMIFWLTIHRMSDSEYERRLSMESKGLFNF